MTYNSILNCIANMKRPTFQSPPSPPSPSSPPSPPSLPPLPPTHPTKRKRFLNVQSASLENEIERVGGKAVILIELRGLI